MRTPWHQLATHEKVDALRAELARLSGRIDQLTFDVDATWTSLTEAAARFGKLASEVSELKAMQAEINKLKAMQSQVSKLTKDVATFKSLWPRSYSKAS